VGTLKSIYQRQVKWILVGAAAVAATRFYYVQEMLAALVLFAVLFSCIAAVLLLVVMLDRVGQTVFEFLAFHAKEVLQHAHEWQAVVRLRAKT
jgi:hypothetical protein